MIKLPFGLAILNPEEYFDFVNGNLSKEQGRLEGYAEARGNVMKAYNLLEKENTQLQRLVGYKEGYAKSLEGVIDRYKQILRKATIIRFALQDALADMLKQREIVLDIDTRTQYELLLTQSPLNELPPPQFIKTEEG